MAKTKNMDKTVGECDECGNILVIVESDDGDWIVGGDKCPECGSKEFSHLEYADEET